ncbi:MAG: DUF371 domain-containing protein [Thaumarchaeota archaeon]|nr:DUF371 domain-containing protein [Nitrososphaerota archaeon]
MKTRTNSAVVTEEISFFGHQMVRATHGRTIEITTEGHLTPSGDCIVGVQAEKGLAQLSDAMKAALRSDTAEVTITLVTPGGQFSFVAHGSRDLTFESETDIVIRRSSFICGRTLAVQAGASANEIPRDLVRTLKSPKAPGMLRIDVHV